MSRDQDRPVFHRGERGVEPQGTLFEAEAGLLLSATPGFTVYPCRRNRDQIDLVVRYEADAVGFDLRPCQVADDHGQPLHVGEAGRRPHRDRVHAPDPVDAAVSGKRRWPAIRGTDDMRIDSIIGPYEDRPAACHEYDPRSAEVARRVAALIEPHLPGAAVEHVGSTAVPGCAGKGVVDLMLVYQDGQLSATRDLLDALGFQRQATRDPFPEERPMRTGSLAHEGTTFILHVHVIAASSPEVQVLRGFRDRLRADAALAAAYVAAKKAILADGYTDPIDYCYRKGEFVTEALRQMAHKKECKRTVEQLERI